MIVLVGFMGAGKTTVGRVLAARLALPFADSDHLVEERTGRAIRDVFARDGEEAFRDLEERAVADLLTGPEAVLALGGGACGRAGTRRALAGHDVVHLRIGLAEALQRLRGDPLRPVLQRPGLPALHAERSAVYDAVSRVAVDVAGRSPEEVTAEVLRLLGHGSASAAGSPP